MEWLIAGIAATLTGAGGLIDFITTNNENIDTLTMQSLQNQTQYEAEQKAAEDEYKIATENAQLAYDQSIEKLELEQKNTLDSYEQSYVDAVKTENLNFENKKKAANYAADVNDKAQTFNEWNYSSDLNRQLSTLRDQQLSEGASFNDASVSIGKSRGDALSAMASSGTRNSSMAQAIDLETAASEAQLQMAENMQRNNDSYQLQSLLLQNAARNFDIQQNRSNNLYQRALYEVGGAEYSSLSRTLNNLENDYTTKVNNLKSEVELSKKQQKENIDTTLSNLKTKYENNQNLAKINKNIADQNIYLQLSNLQDPWKNFLRGSSALLGSGNAGFSTGYNTANNFYKYKSNSSSYFGS